MNVTDAYAWFRESERRIRLFLNWDQPMTSSQLARRVGLELDACRKVIRDFAVYRLIRCLNPAARSSRVYYLTRMGGACQKRIFREAGRRRPQPFVPELDWSLYGCLCYRHRRAILKALVRPMSPAKIKRCAQGRDTKLRMSANNARDVIHVFRRRGIVRPVFVGREARPRYELTEIGQVLRELVCRAEGRAWARPSELAEGAASGVA
jgi:hypothetical protein